MSISPGGWKEVFPEQDKRPPVKPLSLRTRREIMIGSLASRRRRWLTEAKVAPFVRDQIWEWDREFFRTGVTWDKEIVS